MSIRTPHLPTPTNSLRSDLHRSSLVGANLHKPQIWEPEQRTITYPDTTFSHEVSKFHFVVWLLIDYLFYRFTAFYSVLLAAVISLSLKQVLAFTKMQV